jgi:photosynthetic reaction center H subunit
MNTGAITQYVDVAQLTLYAFWLFFFGLVFYLRREDKREGYPLDTDGSSGANGGFFPPVPRPKTFLLPQGHTYQAPPGNPERGDLKARPAAPWPGAPLQPTGNPLVDAVGPAAYAQRVDEPDLTFEATHRIVPLRVAKDFYVEPRDPDPRGMEVLGADREVAGTVSEIWVDRSEPAIKFLEVELAPSSGTTRSVLVPMMLARIDGKRGQVKVKSILASQFAQVPPIRRADQISKLEEDKIMAYFGGGHLYAEPSRLDPGLL